MKRVFSFIIFVFVAKMAIGQHVELNDSIESFGNQIAMLLERTNNSEAARIGQDFNALWPNSFSTEQHAQIMEIAIGMQDKNRSSVPYQRDFFGALTAGVNLAGLSGVKMDNFLNMLSQSLDQSTPRNFSRELMNLRTFFEHEALHFSNYYSLYALNTDYDFEFAGLAPEPSYEEIIMEKAEELEEEVDETDDEWGDESEDGWGETAEDGWGDDSDSGWGDDNTEEEENESNWADVEEDNVVMSLEETTMEIEMPKKIGAIVTFSSVDFLMVTKYDSTMLVGAQGSFLLDKYLFVGEKGKFDWTAAGKAEEIHVTLNKYSFNTRSPYLDAGNVKLSYSEKISKEVNGYFEFKSVKHRGVENSRYPKFISYKNDNRLENLGDENLVFIGGIALEGSRLKGASAYGKPSKMEFTDEEGRKFKTISRLFDFKDSIITSYNSKVSIYHGRDSVTHPSVMTRYYTNEKRFVAVKDNNGYKLRPFKASYFNMNIEADMINWDMKSDSMDITIVNGKSLLPAYFKSNAYYEFEEIKELSGIYNFNPLLVVYNYGAKRKTREFYLSDLIDEVKLNEKALRGAVKKLMYLDFIEFEEAGGRIYLKDKAIHYLRSKNNLKY
jgi:hypothetical protein